MKDHHGITPRQEALAERSLYAAIASLKSVDECRAFFRDLCTPAELQALADRWSVVGLLEAGLPYREIQKQTGVSVTTIGRVARYLVSGNGGYSIASQRLNGFKPNGHKQESKVG
jgi:TrpR-related protein YerC/YecD